MRADGVGEIEGVEVAAVALVVVAEGGARASELRVAAQRLAAGPNARKACGQRVRLLLLLLLAGRNTRVGAAVARREAVPLPERRSA